MNTSEILTEGIRILTDETEPVTMSFLDPIDRTLKRKDVKLKDSWKWAIILHERVKWLVTRNAVPRHWFGLPLASWGQVGVSHFDKIYIIMPKPKKKKAAMSPRKQ